MPSNIDLPVAQKRAARARIAAEEKAAKESGAKLCSTCLECGVKNTHANKKGVCPIIELFYSEFYPNGAPKERSRIYLADEEEDDAHDYQVHLTGVGYKSHLGTSGKMFLDGTEESREKEALTMLFGLTGAALDYEHYLRITLAEKKMERELEKAEAEAAAAEAAKYAKLAAAIPVVDQKKKGKKPTVEKFSLNDI